MDNIKSCVKKPDGYVFIIRFVDKANSDEADSEFFIPFSSMSDASSAEEAKKLCVAEAKSRKKVWLENQRKNREGDREAVRNWQAKMQPVPSVTGPVDLSKGS